MRADDRPQNIGQWMRWVETKFRRIEQSLASTGPEVPGGQPLGQWVTPALNPGWSNFGGSYMTVRYRRDGLTVRGEGLVIGGSGTIYTLPAGFRPSADLVRNTDGNLAFARFDIQADGDIVLVAGSSTYLALDFSFIAEQ